MTEQWNKYDKTAARKHGKPGREVRPQSMTVDIHSHVARAGSGEIRRAASRLGDHSAGAFRECRDQGTEPEAGSRHPRAAGADRRLADLDAMGVDVQMIAPPPPQCYYTVPLDIAVKAAQLVNDGIAAFVAAQAADRFNGFRHGADAGRPRGRERAGTLHQEARLQGRAGPHQCRRQGTVRSGLRAVLEKSRGARRAGDDPSQRLHRRSALVAVLLQQRHRQSAGDHDRAALPDLRRRAGAASEAENPRRARRRLSRRLFRPHRPRLGRALGRPRRPAAAADHLPQERSMSTPWCSRRISSPSWCACSASITSSWAPIIPTTWPISIPSATSPECRASTQRPSRRSAGGNAKKLLGL